jgi:hypothetical protein
MGFCAGWAFIIPNPARYNSLPYLSFLIDNNVLHHIFLTFRGRLEIFFPGTTFFACRLRL